MTDFRKALADLVVAVGNHPDAMMATGDLHTPFMRACAALESSAAPEALRSAEDDPSIHGFTLRDAIQDGLPPSTALVRYEDYFALWRSVRSPRGKLGCSNYQPGKNDSCVDCGETRFSHSNQVGFPDGR